MLEKNIGRVYSKLVMVNSGKPMSVVFIFFVVYVLPTYVFPNFFTT
jgi:hypothetical protein